MLNTLILCYQV